MTISPTRWDSWRGPEGRQAGQGDPVGQAGLGHDRPQANAAGQVGQADHQIPAFPRPTLAGDRHDPLLIGEIKALAPDPALPSHLVGGAPAPPGICKAAWPAGRPAGSPGSPPANRSASSAGRSGSASKPTTTPSRRPDRPPSVAATAASHPAALACSTAWLAPPPERHLRRWRRLGRGSGPSHPLHRWSGRHDPEGSSLGLVGNLVDQRLKALVLIYRPRRGPAGV